MPIYTGVMKLVTDAPFTAEAEDLEHLTKVIAESVADAKAATGLDLEYTYEITGIEGDEDDEDGDDPFESTYTVYKFSVDADREVVQKGLTLEEAQSICNDVDTSGPGWFHGYEED